MFLTPTRYKHFAAMALIGDGMMALVHPSRDALAWKAGPKIWQRVMRNLRENPNLTRTIGAIQIAGGIWWALHQAKKDA